MLKQSDDLIRKIAKKSWSELKLLLEFFVYLLFVCVFAIMAYGMKHPTVYYLTEMILYPFTDKPFMTFEGISLMFDEIMTSHDLWAFAESIMLDGITSDKWYDNTTYVSSTDKNAWMILQENTLIGKPRFRQVRVRNNSCKVHPIFEHECKKCYGPYTPENESKDPYGPGVGPQWNYNECIDGIDYSGFISTYECGGYHQYFEKDNEKNKLLLEDLRQNVWIDRGTRAIFLDFVLYNLNINFFCVVKFVFEFPRAGGIIPSYSHTSFYYLSENKPWEVFIYATQWIFILFIIFFSIIEIYDLFRNFKDHIRSWWNLIEWLIIILSYIVFILQRVTSSMIKKKIDSYIANPNQYISFVIIIHYLAILSNVLAIAFFFTWVKIIDFMSFSNTVTQISSTFSMCAKDLLGFSAVFLLIYWNFVQLGVILFGSKMQCFSTFSRSFFSLLRVILGDFDYDDIKNEERTLGSIFIFTYIFFVIFILLNMFIAIINDTYTSIKSSAPKSKEIVSSNIRSTWLSNKSKDAMERRKTVKVKTETKGVKKIKKHEKSETENEAVNEFQSNEKQTSGKKKIRFEEKHITHKRAPKKLPEEKKPPRKIPTIQKIRKSLIKSGFQEEEVDEFINMYQINDVMAKSKYRTYRFLSNLRESSSESSQSDLEVAETEGGNFSRNRKMSVQDLITDIRDLDVIIAAISQKIKDL